MSYRFRHAICNEVYQGWDFATACRSIRGAGYEGIEIAPFTLSETPAEIAPGERRRYREIMAAEGLRFAGLHWLMVAPKGLHVTTPDPALRERSWRHIHDLIDLCADLAPDRGDNGIMVFGSPKQRGTTGGATREEATRRFTEGLASAAAHAGQRGVTILVEALPSAECDIVNTLAEAQAIVDQIAHPAIRTMFDTHNAADETVAHADIVAKHLPAIRHVHVNEMDGRYPGTGSYDFLPVLAALARGGYGGWVSLEVFDFSPGAEIIAGESLRYLEGVIARLPA
jgi:D-psicose/D-tagatose/L-ribulose 3-epimerase